MQMTLTKIQTGSYTAVEIALDGCAGMADAAVLRKTLKGILQQGYATVLVNLQKARSLDRTCLDRLVSAARDLRRRGGSLILRHCSSEMYAELQAHHWDRCFLVPNHRPADAVTVDMSLGPVLAEGFDAEDRVPPMPEQGDTER